jgi:hypothetical protein
VAESNFVAETADAELVLLGAGVQLPNANRAYYRVVAVDGLGNASGASDYAAAPRPFIYSEPLRAAKVGVVYASRVGTIRSLGDLRSRFIDGEQVASFWDIERPQFTLTTGPTWLRLDERSGDLRGAPDSAGTFEVEVTVTLLRPVRRLDDERLMWGHEAVVEETVEEVGTATQRFTIDVEP